MAVSRNEDYPNWIKENLIKSNLKQKNMKVQLTFHFVRVPKQKENKTSSN